MKIESRYVTKDGTAFKLLRSAVVYELDKKLYKYFTQKGFDFNDSITYSFANNVEDLLKMFKESVKELEESPCRRNI